jgi:hypothetical protein
MSSIDKKQGAVKTSEVANDEALPLLQTGINEDANIIVKQLQRVVADVLTRTGMLLTSRGQVGWDGTKIYFDANASAADAFVKLFQTSPDAASQVIDLKFVGSTVANSPTAFKSITLAHNEILYIELNRALLNSNLTGTLDLANAAGGGSGATGYTVKKVSAASPGGVLKLFSAIDESNTQTLFIPIAYANTYTIGVTTFNDIWWIPHGIRWPKNIVSTLGAVIVEGIEPYPNAFIKSEVDLQTAMTQFATDGGGVGLIMEDFQVNSNISIPDNVLLMSRGSKTVSLTNGAKLTLNNKCTLSNFRITSIAGFNNEMIFCSGKQNIIANMQLDGTLSVNSTATKGIYCNGVNSKLNRIERCKFIGFALTRIGIHYSASSTLNYDLESEFI